MPTINTDTEEGKAELQKLIDAETKGLKTKNEELLGDLKKQKEGLKSVQEQLDELKTGKEQAERDAAEKSGDVEKVKSTLQAAHQKELEKLTNALSAKDAALNKLLVDNGISEALTKAGIAPQFHEAAAALIKTQNKAEITEVDGAAVARIAGESIGDFVTKWSQGDSGKHFVAAQNNSGGGAKGENGGGKAFGGKGDMGGDKTARVAAINAKFPNLNKS